MKRIIVLLLCCISISLCAADYTPFGSNYSMPSAAMQSVNNAGYMSSGSTYSSTVHEVGSSSPNNSPSKGPRRSGFNDITTGGKSTDYDPTNPQLPLGDAILPLILMVMAYAAYILLKRRKAHAMP